MKKPSAALMLIIAILPIVVIVLTLFFKTSSQSCKYFSTPAHFSKVDVLRVPSAGSGSLQLSAGYEYSAGGAKYTSTRIYCVEPRMQSLNRIRAFAHAVEKRKKLSCGETRKTLRKPAFRLRVSLVSARKKMSLKLASDGVEIKDFP